MVVRKIHALTCKQKKQGIKHMHQHTSFSLGITCRARGAVFNPQCRWVPTVDTVGTNFPLAWCSAYPG